jgi:DNA-binding transcriptional regulator PaaX
MGKEKVVSREKLQSAYEMAFFPPRLHEVWEKIKKEEVINREELVDLLEMALTLHRALPERGYSSMRALKRLAYYQAASRDFGTVTFLHNIYRFLTHKDPELPEEVPGEWVRDIGLPPFRHHNQIS